MISYAGIDEATLIHALYHGTKPAGFGVLHDRPTLSVEEVRAELEEGGLAPGAGGEILVSIDYYHGRPLKLDIHLQDKTFEPRYYDRDAEEEGKAAAIVAALRSR